MRIGNLMWGDAQPTTNIAYRKKFFSNVFLHSDIVLSRSILCVATGNGHDVHGARSCPTVTSLTRFLAMRAVVSSISVAIQRRPIFLHAAGTLPPPQNGSTTNAPGSVSFSIRYSTSLW